MSKSKVNKAEEQKAKDDSFGPVELTDTKIPNTPEVQAFEEQEELEPEPIMEPDKEFAKEDIWLFHEDNEPRLFAKGEELPEGWQMKNAWGWHRNPNNYFHWEKPQVRRR